MKLTSLQEFVLEARVFIVGGIYSVSSYFVMSRGGFGRGRGGGFRGGGFRDRGGRGGGGGFRGGRGGRGGFGGGRGGFNSGPPDRVIELGYFTHPCEDDLVCKVTIDDVPFFNAPIYLENKQQIGKIDEIFGPIRDYCVSVKLSEDIKASSFSSDQKIYIDPAKLLPLSRFLPRPPGAPKEGGGSRGGRGRGGRGGRGGFGRGGGDRGRGFGRDRGRGGFGGDRGRGGFGGDRGRGGFGGDRGRGGFGRGGRGGFGRGGERGGSGDSFGNQGGFKRDSSQDHNAVNKKIKFS